MHATDEAYFKEHGEPLFSSHMIDLSEEPVAENIETTAKYLKRAAPLKQWLEREIGITGGEEDGVNNEDVDNNSLYTQPEDIYEQIRDIIMEYIKPKESIILNVLSATVDFPTPPFPEATRTMSVTFAARSTRALLWGS